MNKLDDMTFYSMYGVLQSGMWLLNDLEDYLRPLGMSQARLTILLSIRKSEDGSISPKDIALLTGKSKPSITRTIDKLSKDGLIIILPDQNDARKKRLEITQNGLQILNKIIPEYNQRILRMSENLTESDKKQLLELLGKIRFLDEDKKLGDFL